MPRTDKQRKELAAWERIEAIGGSGVWDNDTVAVSFSKTKVTDEDLELFRDFPRVQMLDLSHTGIGDKGLTKLENLKALESLIVIDTKISAAAIKVFQREHPSVKVTTEPPSKDAINPFTGKPIGNK